MRRLVKYGGVLLILLSTVCHDLYSADIQFSIPYYSVGIIHDSKTGTALGSGFLLDDVRYIVTAWHVVVDERTGREREVVFKPVKGLGTHESPIVTVKRSRMWPDKDIAVMQVDGKSFAKEPLERGNTQSLRVGDMALYGGFDVRERKQEKMSFTVSAHPITGIIGAGEHRLLEIQGLAIPGFSGGPVFGMGSRVIGIILKGRKQPRPDGTVQFYAGAVERIPPLLPGPR